MLHYHLNANAKAALPSQRGLSATFEGSQCRTLTERAERHVYLAFGCKRYIHKTREKNI